MIESELHECHGEFTFKHETAIEVSSESVDFSVFKLATTVDEEHNTLYTMQLQRILILVSNAKNWAALCRPFGLASVLTQQISILHPPRHMIRRAA